MAALSNSRSSLPQSERVCNVYNRLREQLIDRLQALARAHSLILSSDWQDTQMVMLVKEVMAPFQLPGQRAITIDGEAVAISPRHALGLSFVLHELGTNAAKHGALSGPEGRLSIGWQLEGDQGAHRVRLTWREHGGPPVESPTTKGFGTQLIERACVHELGGEVELSYLPGGLVCDIGFPLD